MDTKGKVQQPSAAKGVESLKADIVLSAVGIKTNIENLGLQEVGIAVDRDKILVNDFYQTNLPGYYAIGDVPQVRHRSRGFCRKFLCVEKIAGHHGTTRLREHLQLYLLPRGGLGWTNKSKLKTGYDIEVGRPFSALEKRKPVEPPTVLSR